MTDSHDTTIASAIPRRVFLGGASVVALALPAAAIAAPSVVAADRSVAIAIEAHRSANDAYGQALEASDAAEELFEPLTVRDLVEGLYGRWYEAHYGRDAILANVKREHDRAADAVRASLEVIGVSEGRILSSLSNADAKKQAADQRVNAYFDAEDARRAASPCGAADRQVSETSDAENAAWDAMLAEPCATLADVHAKAAYVMACDRFMGSMLPHDDTAALLQSLIGASA